MGTAWRSGRATTFGRRSGRVTGRSRRGAASDFEVSVPMRRGLRARGGDGLRPSRSLWLCVQLPLGSLDKVLGIWPWEVERLCKACTAVSSLGTLKLLCDLGYHSRPTVDVP